MDSFLLLISLRRKRVFTIRNFKRYEDSFYGSEYVNVISGSRTPAMSQARTAGGGERCHLGGVCARGALWTDLVICGEARGGDVLRSSKASSRNLRDGGWRGEPAGHWGWVRSSERGQLLELVWSMVSEGEGGVQPPDGARTSPSLKSSREGRGGPGPLSAWGGRAPTGRVLLLSAPVGGLLPHQRLVLVLTEFSCLIADWKKRFIGIRMRTITPRCV